MICDSDREKFLEIWGKCDRRTRGNFYMGVIFALLMSCVLIYWAELNLSLVESFIIGTSFTGFWGFICVCVGVCELEKDLKKEFGPDYFDIMRLF